MSGKLNQVLQNFFSKTAQVIIQSRVQASPVYARGSGAPKQNKWFNLELEETDLFREELRLWKSADFATAASVPPLVVETFLDVRSLGPQQALVVTNPDGSQSVALKGGTSRTEIVLERWVIELMPPGAGSGTTSSGTDSTELPVVYKKAIVLFRSLYAYCRLVPTWYLRRRLTRTKLNVSPVTVGCRVLNGANPISSKGRIGLTKPVGDGDSSSYLSSGLDTYYFSPVDTPAGNLRITVSYRTNTNFRVSDSESLLTTEFLNLDHQQPQQQQHHRPIPQQQIVSRNSPASLDYGHGSPSPSIVRERRKSSLSSRGSVGSDHHVPTHKPPVSFIQPFKSPSLSASPSDQGQAAGAGTGAGPSGTRPTSSFNRVPSSSSVAALRIPQRTLSIASSYGRDGGSSGSSDSVPRFSSSFGSRQNWQPRSSFSRPRPQSLFGDQSSSASSSVMEPGSGIYIGDNDVGDFVKLVDSVRMSHARSDRGPSTSSSSSLFGDHEGTTSRGNPLAKYQLLRSNHAALSDSLQSSIHLPPSPVSPTAAVPAPINAGPAPSATGISGPVSSSPAKQSHTPMVPSRLSEEFTVDESEKRQFQALPKKHQNKLSTSGPSQGTALMPLDIPSSAPASKGAPMSAGSRYTQDYQWEPRSLSSKDRTTRRLSFYDKAAEGDQGRPESIARYSINAGLEEGNDDDDLVFAMSDMHVSRIRDSANSSNPYEPLRWKSSDEF
uniref:Autophagy-related protein 13 n=1 Tax=Blastobotrys adeninivorans TaxID=409370 RepID=A0A060T6L4_BLAAD